MKCKLRKIFIAEFNSLKECKEASRNLCSAKIFLLGGKYRIIHKTDSITAIGKSNYIEYFKTLEYGVLIRDF